jgi:SsrA-binding protein
LLHRRELRKFAESAAHQGLTLIPLSVYLSKGKVKVEIAIGRGRKLHDKREKLKKDAANLEMKRALASRQ